MPDEMGAPEGGNVEGGSELDTSLYPGIENVPQEYRQHVDPILREVTKNANTKFEDYSSQLKSWEPYQELGLQDKIDPENLQGLLGLYDAIAAAENGDKSVFTEWWNSVGNDFELFDSNSEDEFSDEFEEQSGQLTQDQINQAIQDGIAKQMEPFMQAQQQAQENEELEAANASIDQEFEPIKEQLGDKFTPEVERAILKLGLGYDQESVKHGFMDWKAMVEAAQGEVFANVENQPAAPEGPGIPNTTPQKITDFKDATAFAEEYLQKQAANQ